MNSWGSLAGVSLISLNLSMLL